MSTSREISLFLISFDRDIFSAEILSRGGHYDTLPSLKDTLLFFHQMQTSSCKWQWQRPGTTANTDFRNLANSGKNQPNMFLNVDMAIAWDLDSNGGLDTSDGKAQCVVEVDNNNCIATPSAPCCAKATTNIGSQRKGNIFLKYVNDNAVFVSKFSEVFIKMTEVRETESLSDVMSSSNDEFRRRDERKRVHHKRQRIDDDDDEDEDEEDEEDRIEQMLYDYLHH